MQDIESTLAVSRLIVALTEEMTPGQRRAAAERLRALEGDESTRRLFADIAAGLDDQAAAERDQ